VLRRTVVARSAVLVSGSVNVDYLAIAVASAIAVAIAALLVRAQLALRRHRRQIAALMERLDAVELVASDSSFRPPRHPEPAEGRDPDQISSDDDVLAGRTTYVAAMIEGAAADELSAADKTILCIHENIHRPLLPRDLAKELHVSLRSLERVLAATLDCTPTELIATMKMREARRLLLSGSLRVSEVAYRLGFSSPAHFSSRFKSFYRVAPSRLSHPADPQGAPPEGIASDHRTVPPDSKPS
jgi:AraC-like DNA-binding protein